VSLIDPSVYSELRTMADDDQLGTLIDAFREETPLMVAAMERALAANDVDTFRRSAHSLKSNAYTFGANALGELARELEAMARAGNLDVGSRVQAVREACDAVSVELAGMRP
jgi:HPt (histidine-containing phosphotransfer) domain-containing protein